MSSPEPQTPQPKAKDEMICMMAATIMQRLIPAYESTEYEVDKNVQYAVSIANKIYALVNITPVTE